MDGSRAIVDALVHENCRLTAINIRRKSQEDITVVTEMQLAHALLMINDPQGTESGHTVLGRWLLR